jgi:hypothetical protein
MEDSVNLLCQSWYKEEHKQQGRRNNIGWIK